MIIHIKTTEEFKNYIDNNDCFVDFYTTWCGPCKMLSPIIEELDEKGAFGNIKILKVDAEECYEVSNAFRIQAVPTLMLFKGGKLIRQNAGYMNESEILDFIK